MSVSSSLYWEERRGDVEDVIPTHTIDDTRRAILEANVVRFFLNSYGKSVRHPELLPTVIVINSNTGPKSKILIG
jgi:hypothetical protein